MERFNLSTADIQVVPRYNIAPTQPVAVVLDESPTTLSGAQWGLIPSWSKDPAIGSRMINARAETLTEKPSFRGLVKKRRCLILADSFYEWRKNEDGSKTPTRILLNSAEPFALAGLWDVWKTPEGDWLKTCTVITTEPNELMSQIHNRMPAILPRAVEQDWINKANDVAHIMALLKPYDAKAMRAYEVSKTVNSPKNDDASLIAAV